MFLIKLQNSYLFYYSLSFSNNRQFRSRISSVDFRFRFRHDQQKYENKNNLAVFRSFSIVFIPTLLPSRRHQPPFSLSPLISLSSLLFPLPALTHTPGGATKQPTEPLEAPRQDAAPA